MFNADAYWRSKEKPCPYAEGNKCFLVTESNEESCKGCRWYEEQIKSSCKSILSDCKNAVKQEGARMSDSFKNNPLTQEDWDWKKLTFISLSIIEDIKAEIKSQLITHGQVIEGEFYPDDAEYINYGLNTALEIIDKHF